MRIHLWGALAALLNPALCLAESDPVVHGPWENMLKEKLTPYIEETIRTHDLPGLAVGVVRDGKIVYAEGFGYRNTATRERVDGRTVFHMASVSKPFVAAAIMQLAAQGKLKLEDPIVRHLPYFRLQGEGYQRITIQQMLSHVSGTPDVQDYEWENPDYAADALERYVKGLGEEKMLFGPGEKFAYSNMAYECLGDLIANVSGMSFAAYQKKYLLEPSGMADSDFLKPEHLPENWAAPHIRLIAKEPWSAYPYNRRHGPSSTLHASALDMCRWAITNLNKGHYAERRILDAEAYDRLWKPWFSLGEDRHIGLSWFLGQYRGERSAEHGGADTGFNTILRLLPDKSMAVAVMCNQDPAPVEGIAQAALDLLLGYEPKKIKIPAGAPVCRVLQESGAEAAIELWTALERDQPDAYDFEPNKYIGLFEAIKMGRTAEAVSLTHLAKGIFPPEILERVESETAAHLQEAPDNKAAAGALRVLRGS